MAHEKTCLVIGANGFIGSHLVDELVTAGYKVRALDRFSGEPQFIGNSQIEVVKADIFDDTAMKAALSNVDYVFHSFSATTPFTSDTDPYTDITQNLLRNVQLFERMVEAKVKKVVFISSGGAVYGHIAEVKEADEEDAPTPVSPYGINKLATEHYLAYFNRKFGLEYLVYRLTNPYGPRQVIRNSQGVIPAFLSKISSGEEITIYGDGTSSRDFVYIRDATKMMVESFTEETKFRTYNLGRGRQTTLNEILDTMKAVIKKPIKVTYVEAPKTFLGKTQVSTKRFTDEFGDHAQTDLLTGIRTMLQ
jgi:UDP-glucose 4-epimerase